MPTYEIIETPGKERVWPRNEDDQVPRTQDEAKIIMQRLRAEAKVEGRQVDFIIRPTSGAGARQHANGTGAAATSVRLTEENRSSLARFCGRCMMETGVPMTMGDAVAKLIDFYDTNADISVLLKSIVEGEDTEVQNAVILAAREIRTARKAAEG